LNLHYEKSSAEDIIPTAEALAYLVVDAAGRDVGPAVGVEMAVARRVHLSGAGLGHMSVICRL
jgi:hypothetical protein